jgi:hypothetical protein
MKNSLRPFALGMVLFLSLACSLADKLFPSSGATASPKTVAPESVETSAPANIPAPSFENWPIYTNAYCGFQLKYPPEGQVLEENDIFTHIELPFAQGTTMTDKYLEVNVYTNADSCESREYGGDPSKTEQVQINGLDWKKEAGGSGGAGSFHDWTGYSTNQAGTCVNLNFYILSIDPSMEDPTPPAFDRYSETAVFGEIVSTFEWLGS